MFDIEELVAACRDALQEGGSAAVAVKDVIERAVADPGPIEQAVGDVRRMQPLTPWHVSPELTVLHVVWPPGSELFPHEHRMWATIGLYGGREDNRFFRRRPDDRIESSGERTLLRGDAVALGHDTVHSVANPSREWTGAIHVYGGDFFATPRDQWADDGASAQPHDPSIVIATLAAAAERALAAEAGA